MKLVNHSKVEIEYDEVHLLEVETLNRKLSRHDRNDAKAYLQASRMKDNSYYSVSYSYPYIMMYWSNQKIAIDLECHSRFKPKHVQLFATEQEIKLLNQFIIAPSSFVTMSALWTIKEAIGKYYGVGLNFGLHSIYLSDTGGVCCTFDIDETHTNMKMIVGIGSHYSFTIVHDQSISEQERERISIALQSRLYLI